MRDLLPSENHFLSQGEWFLGAHMPAKLFGQRLIKDPYILEGEEIW